MFYRYSFLLRHEKIKLCMTLLLVIVATGHVFGTDADFWKVATTYEQKYIFVGGMVSGLVAAEKRTHVKYQTVFDASKELSEYDRKLHSGGALAVWEDLSNVTIYILLDDKFIPDFIKYLDYYFTNPKNKYAGDALMIFLSERTKND